MAKTKIYAPNKEYSGVSASVTFVNGVGETDNQHLIDWFRSKGYGIGKPVEEKKEIPKSEPVEEKI